MLQKNPTKRPKASELLEYNEIANLIPKFIEINRAKTTRLLLGSSVTKRRGKIKSLNLAVSGIKTVTSSKTSCISSGTISSDARFECQIQNYPKIRQKRNANRNQVYKNKSSLYGSTTIFLKDSDAK
jgi:hypothetical protein